MGEYTLAVEGPGDMSTPSPFRLFLAPSLISIKQQNGRNFIYFVDLQTDLEDSQTDLEDSQTDLADSQITDGTCRWTSQTDLEDSQTDLADGHRRWTSQTYLADGHCRFTDGPCRLADGPHRFADLH